MTAKTAPDAMHTFRNQVHPDCIVCGPANQRGLHLDFALGEDGRVQAAFDCDAAYEGFPGIVHGGVICMLLDGAMTNCLFAHGHDALAGELNVRFRHPLLTGQTASVRAWIERESPPYHLLNAELTQNEQIKARAVGKFVDRPRSATDRGHSAAT